MSWGRLPVVRLDARLGQKIHDFVQVHPVVNERLVIQLTCQLLNFC
jgi:hypothetical protein